MERRRIETWTRRRRRWWRWRRKLEMLVQRHRPKKCQCCYVTPSKIRLIILSFLSVCLSFLMALFLDYILFCWTAKGREREEKKKMMATRISTRDFPFPPYWLPFLHAIFCCLCLSRSLFLSLPSSLVSFAFDSNSYMTNRWWQ